MGKISFMSEYGDPTGHLNPHEFAVDFGYTRLLSENLSGALVIRYIRSDLNIGQLVNGSEPRPGNSLATDISLYYLKYFQFN